MDGIRLPSCFGPRLDFCFLVSFRGEFLGHGFLEFFSVHSVAFGGVHENVVAAYGGSAVRAKDIIGAMSSSASDILSFDVVDPLQYVGLDALKKHLEGWYSSFQGPIGLEICELNTTAGNDGAFSHSLNQVIGTKTDGKKIEMYWRATGCYRKVDGKWLVSHEHNSVPFEPASGKASLHLKP
jgi:ketosteroid isomerase-like protein